MSLISSITVRSTSMPKGTYSLFIIQLVSTLSFSVLYSTLVLYMKGKLGMDVRTANSIMGVFIAFNYALHLLGGFWGGRLLSNRALFCVGMIAQTIGCIMLSTGELAYLTYGLAAFLTGAGLNVTCLNCMLTQRFSPEDSRRETAFLWNYAGMNVGFFIGFSLSGVYQLSQNYHTLFLLSSLGNVTAFLICLLRWKALADINTPYSKLKQSTQRKVSLWGLVCILSLPILLSKLLQYADLSNKLVLITGVLMMGYVVFLSQKQETKEAKDKMKAFAIFMIVSTVFWTLFQIGPMGLTVFTEHNVQRDYLGFMIPPQWFQNINTVSIVIGGPLLGALLAKLRRNGAQVNIPSQFALALLFIGLAFAILPIGISFANSDGLVSPNWILACYILQSIGELLISPIGYAMIGSLAPSHLQGSMMGIWMLNSGVGGTLASYSSNLMVNDVNSSSAILTNTGYSHVFLSLGLFSIACSVMLYFVVPILRELIHDNNKLPNDKPDSDLAVSKRVTLCE